MLRDEIISRINEATHALVSYCHDMDEARYFQQPPDKWSIAQNVDHLFRSANATRVAYRLPKFIIRLYTGKPNRPSRSFDELVERYKTKLAKGGKASGPFIPKIIPASLGRARSVKQFEQSMQLLVNSMKNTTDSDLDRYLAPHPLLGKITLRELGYFTIHHSYHHLDSIRKIAGV